MFHAAILHRDYSAANALYAFKSREFGGEIGVKAEYQPPSNVVKAPYRSGRRSRNTAQESRYSFTF